MKILIAIIIVLVTSSSAIAQPGAYLSRLNDEYTSGVFRSDNAHLLVPMDDVAAPTFRNVFQYLQGRVPGLYIYQVGFQFPTVIYRSGYPAFFINEMRVGPDALNSINMNDVAIIKVFRPPFLGAIGGGADGAIAVYTKNGDDEVEA